MLPKFNRMIEPECIKDVVGWNMDEKCEKVATVKEAM